MALTRKQLKKKAELLFKDFGGPMDVGLRHFTEYVQAVLDYIDEKVDHGTKN